MMFPSNRVRVLASTQPIDFRKGHDGLAAVVSSALRKDSFAGTAFYDFPAEHWKHIRTTNPIESTFATVRHRTTKTKGCLSSVSALAMTHQLMLFAKTKWRKLDGQNRLPEIIQRV